jgi:hypothetical protein
VTTEPDPPVARPRILLPLLAFAACSAAYISVAVDPALPRVIPRLLEQSLATESELVRSFRIALLALAVIVPPLVVFATACTSRLLLAGSGVRVSFGRVASIFAWGGAIVGAGLLVKAGLVLITNAPEPPVNLGFLIRPRNPAERVFIAFTNPFSVWAIIWSVRSFRRAGARRARAVIAGGAPWVAVVVIAARAGGAMGGIPAHTMLSREGWQTTERPTLLVSHPPEAGPALIRLVDELDAFAVGLGERYGFEPRPFRLHFLPDHKALERATGDVLHASVTGSIRGESLLYLEIPGQSALVTPETSRREAMRYVALMQMAGPLAGAPRWFVEGLAHAGVRPWDRDLERRFRVFVQERGRIEWETLTDASLYQTAMGPLVARSITRHLAYRFGAESPADIAADVAAGTPFRDALFARTRLTMGALEAEWAGAVEALRKLDVSGQPEGLPEAPEGDAPPNEADPHEPPAPFRTLR